MKLKGYLLNDNIFRVYNSDYTFIDYEIVASELICEIDDPFVMIRTAEDGTQFIDYTDAVLGRD